MRDIAFLILEIFNILRLVCEKLGIEIEYEDYIYDKITKLLENEKSEIRDYSQSGVYISR